MGSFPGGAGRTAPTAAWWIASTGVLEPMPLLDLPDSLVLDLPPLLVQLSGGVQLKPSFPFLQVPFLLAQLQLGLLGCSQFFVFGHCLSPQVLKFKADRLPGLLFGFCL